MASKSNQARIEKRKRLDALFDRGDYVRFGVDGDGRPVANPETESDRDVLVWVGPPSPFQREMAVREAQARRARVMIEARDEETSATAVTLRNYIRSLTADALIDYIVDLEESSFLTQARRDVLTNGEWDDFAALRDAMRQYEEAGSPQGDPEWDPLLEKDRKFGDQVILRAAQLKDDARAGYKVMSRPRLEENALERRIEQAGSAAFMDAYEEWMLFYSCRDDQDHNELFFDSVEDMRSQDDVVQTGLSDKLASFIQDTAEAKN